MHLINIISVYWRVTPQLSMVCFHSKSYYFMCGQWEIGIISVLRGRTNIETVSKFLHLTTSTDKIQFKVFSSLELIPSTAVEALNHTLGTKLQILILQSHKSRLSLYTVKIIHFPSLLKQILKLLIKTAKKVLHYVSRYNLGTSLSIKHTLPNCFCCLWIIQAYLSPDSWLKPWLGICFKAVSNTYT